MQNQKPRIDDIVRSILDDILGIGADRADALTDDSGLFGTIPELDSMAVANLLTEMEDRFDIMIDDDEVEAEIFETFGGLVRFAERKVKEKRAKETQD